MNALSQFLTRRPRAPKHGSDETAMPVNAAPSPVSMPLAAPVTAPQGPTFTPNARNLASTQPFTAPAPRTARGTHARTARRHVQQDDAMLRRVRDGIQAIPLSRPAQFTADLQKPKDGGIPVFRRVVANRGFCGLDEEYRPAPLTAHGTQAWAKLAEETAGRFDATQAELGGTIAEQDRHEARRRVAADAALALGYPGSAL